MQSKKATMTSRREFVSNAVGIALVTALTWQARADQGRSIHEQSDNLTSSSGSATQNRSLRWDVFLSPSIPATAIDLAPGGKERPWPPISSTLISGERDAVLVDTPSPANKVIRTEKSNPNGHLFVAGRRARQRSVTSNGV
jgi:hypothetical protein